MTSPRAWRYRARPQAAFAARLLAAAMIAWPNVSPAQVVEAPMRAVALAPAERMTLDATLAHPAWARAPAYEQFVEHNPRHGAAPPQATSVRVLFDEEALWIGVVAHDTEPERIRRPLVRHDLVNRTQDFLAVYLDPIGTRRAAQFFRINAAGSRADGLHTAADDSEDFAPDYDWDGAAAPRADGWSAIWRIPFASLRYAEGEQGRWRIQVVRRLPREQMHLVLSVALPRETASFIDQMQPLEGVALPPQHAFLTLRPSITARAARSTGDGGSASGAARREQGVDASLDIKWRPRAELVIDGTIAPDFSQVELDVPQLAGNTRFALFLPEKRPFFFEAADLLRTPTDAVYTRGFTDPSAGARATWRGSRIAGTAMLIADRGGGAVLLPARYGTDFAPQPASTTLAARARVDDDPLQWGALVASRRYTGGAGVNDVLGPDLQWQLDAQWRLRAQWLYARTTAWPGADGRLVEGPAREGSHLLIRFNRAAHLQESTLWFEDIGQHFRNDSGYRPQADVRTAGVYHGVGWRPFGPFNDFWLNLNAARTEERGSGRVIGQSVVPGLWFTAPHNFESFIDWHLFDEERPGDGAPLLRQHYVSTGVTLTPAPWMPLLSVSTKFGRMVDVDDAVVRRGRQLSVSATMRPLARLELESSLSGFRFAGDGAAALDNRVARVLAVWHLDARSHLRLIAQRATLARHGQPSGRQDAATVSWSRRVAPATIWHAGVSHQASGEGRARPQRTEAFVKLQFDLDDLRRAWSGARDAAEARR